MKEEEIKTKVLEMFNEVRQSPNIGFDESNFLDFLIDPPSKKGNIKNSFKGVRKYFNFFSVVELEFGICFSLGDQDKSYSIDKFVSLIKKRIENKRGNELIIQQRIKEKHNYYIEFILTLILVTLIAVFKILFISILGIVFYGIAMLWIVSSRLKDRRHTEKLYKIIMNKDAR